MKQNLDLNEIIERCKSSDRRAQELLFKQFYGKMLAVCMRYLHDHDSAQEVVQEGFIKVNDTIFRQQYTYIPATVINLTVSKRNNYFTLNIGRKQGVYRGLGVFSDKGVVGVIHNTSEHYSVVKSVLTKDINIDVTIEPIGLFGLLKWSGRDARRGSISGISNDLRIKKGSKVVTKGGSGIFPKGLAVGVVEKINPIEGEPLWDVVVKFSENFRTIQRVYVVKNLMIEEQKNIEKNIPDDEEE